MFSRFFDEPRPEELFSEDSSFSKFAKCQPGLSLNLFDDTNITYICSKRQPNWLTTVEYKVQISIRLNLTTGKKKKYFSKLFEAEMIKV
jgi:hypothetical protein